MSVASSSSFACIKLRSPSSPTSSSSSPSSSSFSSSTFRFSTAKPTILTIRSSQAEGPIRRPVAPPPTPVKPIPPSPPPSFPAAASPPPTPSAPPKPVAVAAVEDKNVITLEFQRQKAKELQEYFKQKKLEEADQGPFFGFIGKNEIANGSGLRYCLKGKHDIKLGRHIRDVTGQGQLHFSAEVMTLYAMLQGLQTNEWAMFGFAVGMLTEYATGSDFVDQVKILLSNFGIVDLE